MQICIYKTEQECKIRFHDFFFQKKVHYSHSIKHDFTFPLKSEQTKYYYKKGQMHCDEKRNYVHKNLEFINRGRGTGEGAFQILLIDFCQRCLQIRTEFFFANLQKQLRARLFLTGICASQIFCRKTNFQQFPHSRPENLKKFTQKNLLKSNKSFFS